MHAQAADAGPDAVTLLYNEVRRIARAYPADGGPALLPALTAAQRFAFRHLDGPTQPDQARDLYFLTGVLCGLLAHAGLDLGQIDAAMTQTRTALLCADRAGHPGLRTWLRNEQCTITRWAGWHHESLRYVQLAATDAAVIRGTAAVGRALREARAQAAIGNADEARAALTAATEAREQAQPDELDEIGGQITLSTPDGLFVAADALSLLPDPAAAEQAANFAVSAFDDIPANQAKFGNAACTRIILSLARFRQGDVDGARDALRPVLDLPPQQRLYGIMTNMQRVQVTLTDARYHGSPTARDTAAEIETFAQLGARTALPE
ncbi:hypothetical protein [Frankia sp. Cas4]|uniref:hypothetical protein n=1 Tax=Frankia sp. Cas4 TaxID=3073927 RepID=UPI002AD474FB|nr:hypothetical protein [Frankia sp. Cas4]